MAKKKEKDDFDIVEKIQFWDEMEDSTIQAILAILSFLVTLISLLAAFGKAGPIGENLYKIFWQLFGVGYYLIPISFVMLGLSFVKGLKRRFEISKIVGVILFFLSGLGIIFLLPEHAGGIIGKWIATPLLMMVDIYATSALLIALIIVSVFIVFNVSFGALAFWNWFKKEKKPVSAELDESEKAKIAKAVNKAGADMKTRDIGRGKNADSASDEASKEDDQNAINNMVSKGMSQNPAQAVKKGGKLSFSDDEEAAFASAVTVPLMRPYNPPPLSLLEKDRGKAETGDIKANANLIKRTMANFGISVEMDEISIGPSVTRYALKPAEGVKLTKIVALNDNLALALAAHPIRIEAPIPGKSLVGIEVPNSTKTTVGLATLLASADFSESEKPLMVSLGKDITGRAHFANLAKAPHMLIAGATGSGKSVSIHALITSLLYRNSPEDLKFIMIDPKRVELTLYRKIPHLLTPVITDPKKAILSLKWAAKEMSRRYDLLEKHGMQNIDSYHKGILAPAVAMKVRPIGADGKPVPMPDTMPYIAIVIDELADIMQTYPRELESAIVRLAQMSRAVGIHLIISTQRPSVNVITGLIKANIPTRIALQVASQIDSRTILDQQGAEKLLGAGDMLYLGGEMSKPVRLQSAFISENEVKRVVKYLSDEYKDAVPDEINLTPPEAGSSAAFDSLGSFTENDSLDDDDDLYEDARQLVTSTGQASTSFIQRKLGIGYSRAAKLIDMMEARGIVGPKNGSKAREIMGVGNADATTGQDSQSETSSSVEGQLSDYEQSAQNDRKDIF